MMSKKAIVLTALAAVLTGLGILQAYAVDTEAAERRLRDVMERVTPAGNPSVADTRTQPEVPNLEGIRHQVPQTVDFSKRKHIPDPFEVAERFKKRSGPVDAPVDMAAARDGDLLVFVSFSMPEASLKRIAHETARAGGVMVIRGFKDGSMNRTVEAAEQLAALQADLLIHPELFDHYQIHEVPATVLAKAGEDNAAGCAANAEEGLCTEHYQVLGDVSLHASLEYFTRLRGNGELTRMAEARLAKLEGKK